MSATIATRTDHDLVEVLAWWDTTLGSRNPLAFPGYHPPDPEEESVRVAAIRLAGAEAVWIDCDFARSGGTMGVVAGERIVRAFDSATARRLPVVATVSSGGARLQEGMFSLVQMPRTAAAVRRHRTAGQRFVAHLDSPTTGGVFASWASLADLSAAAPGATIGFGGPRVVQQVTGSLPPPDSHTAESALGHGIVDAVVPRDEAWAWLAGALGIRPAAALALPPGRAMGVSATFPVADPYEHLLRCRAAERPSGLEWAAWLTTSWTEIRGSSPAIRAGVAELAGRQVVVIAIDRHAGVLPAPEAFRLARRAIAVADRWGLPVVTLVDTPGADPSPPSEAGGIAGEIAETLLAMAGLRTPSVCLVVGEGGSGGAMALAHTDRLLMLRGAAFAVIGPEAGAVVLHRDAGRAAELARAFGLTADELRAQGVADRVVPEIPADVIEAVSQALDSAASGRGRESRLDILSERALVQHAGGRP